MRNFLIGLLVGLVFSSGIAMGSENIKLIVNGEEIPSDPSPQFIGDRVFVPVRFVSEALGADVDWDDANRAVVINSQGSPGLYANNIVSNEMPAGYYSGREIVEAVSKKYPNIKPTSNNLNIEPQKGEFRFNLLTGELWFDRQKFLLPIHKVNDRLYFSIHPLIEAKILSPDDI